MEEKNLKSQFPFEYKKQKQRESVLISTQKHQAHSPVISALVLNKNKSVPQANSASQNQEEKDTRSKFARRKSTVGALTNLYDKPSSMFGEEKTENISDPEDNQNNKRLKESKTIKNYKRRISMQKQKSQSQETKPYQGQSEDEDEVEANIELLDKDVIERFEFEFLQSLRKKQVERLRGHFLVHGKHVFFAEKSLFVFSSQNILRKGLVWFIKWKWFQWLITFIIILNSINLSIYDYSDRDSKTEFNRVIDQLNRTFTFVFLLESIVKIIAMGFIIHHNSYMRDGWNVLDLFIVISGLIELLAYDINFKALRILRVIRPLRSIKASPSMRRQVSTLLKSIPEIGNATIFLNFMTGLFAILGLQQFMGVVYYRCRLTEKPINGTYWPMSQNYTRICSPGGDGNYQCPIGTYCGSPLEYGISLKDDGVFQNSYIQFGISTFDNIIQSFLGVFQVLTVEGWTELMYNIADGYSSIFAEGYFCLAVILGHYYMLQLLLAVIISNLSKIQAQEAHNDISFYRRLVDLDRATKHVDVDMKQVENNGFDFVDEGGAQKKEEKKEATPMSEMAKALKEARAKKLEAQKKAEEEAKAKEAQANLTPMQQMAAAIKKGKEEKAMKEQEEKKRREEADAPKIIIQEVEISPEVREEKKQKEIDDKVKSTLMWSVAGENEGQENLSSGLGLALLSRALGVQKMEDKFSRHMNNIKKTKMITKLELRLKLQTKILDDVGRLTRQTDLDVSKMYWRSKKNVYGIDNELHLVEQVQRCMSIIFNDQILERKQITHDDINKIFEFEKKDQKNIEDDQAWVIYQKPQLDLHLYLALKIAFNLKELTLQQNVRNFFFTRFKRRLIKKSIVDNIEIKTHKYIIETGILIRARQSRLYQSCNDFSRSRIFKTTTSIAIISNGIILGLSSDKNEYEFEKILEYINVGFFVFFVIELISKLIGQGFKHYLRDKFNWFDGLVVIVSAIDISLQYSIQQNTENSSSGALTALRVFRLIRIFQLAHLWKEFQELLSVVINTLKDVSNISVLILIFVFSYMLIGLELFAFRLPPLELTGFIDRVKHRPTFNSFIESFFSVFIVLIGDGWTEIYFQHYTGIDPYMSSIFFMSLIILGQFILVNLFISVLIENFEQISIKNDLVLKLTDIETKSLSDRLISIFFCIKKNKVVSDDKTKKRSKIEEMMDDKYQDQLRKQDQDKIESKSLFLFSFNGWLRQNCISIVEHKNFEWIMLAIIILSSFQLALDNPLNNPSTLISGFYLYFDYVLSGIFLIEVFLKIIGYGVFMCGSKSYLNNYWNILDLFIISITIGSYFTSSGNLNAIKVFKLIKVLRPIRAISKNPGLRISIKALGVALPGILDIFVVMFLFYFIFGIITVNYFKGQLYYCDPVGLQPDYLSTIYNSAQTKWDCLNTGSIWKNKFMNFDSTLDSMATLFIISNAVQWNDVLYHVLKIKGIDRIPGSEIQNISSGLFFTFIIIVGNFFLLNLFVGIVISKYNREKELQGKNFYLTEEQKKWVKNRMNILQAQPKYMMKLPFDPLRQPFFYIAESIYIQYFIMLCIIINTIILMMQWIGQTKELNQILENLNFIFALIFTCEFIIKYIGYGKRLFYDGWNTFDMIIVITSIVGIIMGQYSSYNFGPQTTIIRSFRIVRVFYFFKKNKALKGTLMTFMVSLPAMANIGSLLVLIILIYAIMGVYLFAQVKLNGQLDVHANFQTIGCGFLTLIRVITGENWPLLMEALSREYDLDYQCIQEPTFEDFVNNKYQPVGCGNFLLAKLYFFSYILFVATIFMRLFIAIILQTFQQATERENKFMNTDLSNRFRDIWARFDGNATSFMRVHCYPKFLQQLGEPLGWDSSFEHNFLKQQEYLNEISLPKYNTGGEYYFMDVFEQLILIMIIRREVINFGIKTKHYELLGATRNFDQEQYQIIDEYDQQNLNLSFLKQDGITRRDTDVGKLLNSFHGSSTHSRQSSRQGLLNKSYSSLRDLTFGKNLNFKPSQAAAPFDNSYVDIINQDEIMQRDEQVITQEDMIEYEMKAMENERNIHRIVHKDSNEDQTSQSSSEEMEEELERQLDQDMKIVEEEMKTIKTKKDIEYSEDQQDIEAGLMPTATPKASKVSH